MATSEVRIYVLDCGQGDTVLLNLEDKVWVLIDCHLPKGTIRNSFFHLVEKLRIQRLEAVCLTHPHEDHYWGMADVIQHFTSNGRTLGYFLDSGANSKDILALMRRKNRPKSSVSEFERLNKLLDELIDRRVVRYKRLDADSLPFLAGESTKLISIGPPADILRRSVRSGIAWGSIRDDLNFISIIISLQVQGTTKAFDALLAADTDGRNLNSALERLAQRSEPASVQFDLVKVAHHGSGDSHKHSRVCRFGKPASNCVAVISVGTKYDVHPDREVLREYLENDWVVLLTTKRVPRRRNYVLEIAGKGLRNDYETRHQTVEIRWSEEDGMTWSDETRLQEDELLSYATVMGVKVKAITARRKPSPKGI